MLYLDKHLAEQSIDANDLESRRLEFERQRRPRILELIRKRAERRQADAREVAAGYFQFDRAEEYRAGGSAAAAEVH